MYFITFNPELVLVLIRNLTAYVEAAESERYKICSSSADALDPVPSVEEATHIPFVYSAPMIGAASQSGTLSGGETYVPELGSAISTLYAVINDLSYRHQQIIDLNSNGLTTTNADGTVNYCLPDGISDTAANIGTYNFEAAATARADADALTQATNSKDRKADDGRTIDDIMASMTDNQGNPVYANAVITENGPENLTSLPISVSSWAGSSSVEEADRIADALGGVLASASTIWDEERSQEVADAISGSVDEEGEYGRVTALNAILSRDDDGNGVNDLDFGSSFLIDLANKLDDIDYKTIGRATAYPKYDGGDVVFGSEPVIGLGQADTRAKILGDSMDWHSFDPMTGVLKAMGGNPDAALGYLAPAGGDGSVDTSRIDDLSARDWDEEGLSGFTAALAAGSSLRTSEGDDQAARATSLADYGIHDLAQNTNAKNYTDGTKSHIGVLLANCPAEVQEVFIKGNATDVDHPDAFKLDAATIDDINTLTYRVIDNPNAARTMSTGLAGYARRCSAEGVAVHEGDPAGQTNSIREAYTNSAQAMGCLSGMADQKAEDLNASARDKANENVSTAKTATSAFFTVAGAALGSAGGPVGAVAGGTAGKTAWAAGSSFLSPVVADAVTPDAQSVDPSVDADIDSAVWAAAVRDAADTDLIDQAELAKADSDYDWITQDPDTGRYTIDLDGADAQTYRDVKTWTDRQTSPTSTSDHTTLDNLSLNFDGAYASGQNKGMSEAIRQKESS
ncbi:DUF6571 family protein [uncultured Actinomyces sp.]|uniref:DUF6571 family protein n=1 Tax=uncultured Actinomyces sp. TaxID=249061 RepID=UPI0028E76699|nr:DUF6571 family protein [uncultured Actinomyces sp.]